MELKKKKKSTVEGANRKESQEGFCGSEAKICSETHNKRRCRNGRTRFVLFLLL